MNSSNMRRLAAALAALLLICTGASAAEYWENERYFTEKYEDNFSLYRDFARGSNDARITKSGERLAELGYFSIPRVTNDSITNTMGIAISVFCQQMGIGGKSDQLTRLTQAVLFSDEAQPALFPPVYERAYSQNEEARLTVYSMRALQQLKQDAPCCVRGLVTEVVMTGESSVSLRIALDGDDGSVRVSYNYPNRSSRFMPGDYVIAFGTMADAKAGSPLINGELIGFVP